MRHISALSLIPLLLILAAAGPDAVPLEAQGAVQLRAGGSSDSGAWLGVSLRVLVQRDSARTRSSLTVSRVEEGGPADVAGLQPGDRILRVNGRAATLARFQDTYERLRPGERMSLTLLRDERWQGEVLVQAAPRPAAYSLSVPTMLAARIDSALQRLDSLQHQTEDARVFRGTMRLTLEESRAAEAPESEPDGERVRVGEPEPGTERVRVVAEREPGTGPVRVAEPEPGTGPVRIAEGEAGAGRVVVPERARDSALRAFVFRTAPDASRRVEADELERTFREARAAEAQHLHSLASRAGPGGQIDMNEPELVRLRSRRIELARRLVELRQDLASGADEAPPSFPPGPAATSAPREGTVRIRTPDAPAAVRAFIPWLEGQNRVAGAELVGLNPQLASYFQVEEGLLVTEVISGTPAADAGLRPGDVVTHLGERPLRTLEDLREGLQERAGRHNPLTVVRQGERLEMRLVR